MKNLIRFFSLIIALSMLFIFVSCNHSPEVETSLEGDNLVTESESDSDEIYSEEDKSEENESIATDTASDTEDTSSSTESNITGDSESNRESNTESDTEKDTDSDTEKDTESESGSESKSETESELETGPSDMDAEEIVISVFADFHYEQDVYMSTIADFNAILDRANENGADIVLQMGDLCLDFAGSPEFLNAYRNNKYNIPIYGVYGNHDLQTAGNTMSIVTPYLTNRQVKWGTSDGKIGDGTIGYYYTDVNGFRVISVDSNYYYDPATSEWKHSPDGTYIIPSDGTCEAALGPVQLAWLESVILDAAEKDIPCIVMAHHTFNGMWSGRSYDWQAVQAIYRKANLLNPGTVVLSMNGHTHSNRQAVIEGVVYFDVNTALNGYVIEDSTKPNYRYTTQTFEFIRYDENGNQVGEPAQRLVSELKMAPYMYFFENPLSAIVTVTKDGKVTIEGMETEWLGGIAPEDTFPYRTPAITSFEYNASVCEKENIGVEVFYPAYTLGNNCVHVQSIGGFEMMNENGLDFVRIYGGNSKYNYNMINIYSNDGSSISGQYLVFKYRIPADRALDQSTLYMYAGTVNKTATGEQENITIKVSEDGDWHIAVVDLGTLVGNASGNLFSAAEDGKYYAKFIQMRPVTAYGISGYDHGSLDDYMDIAYLAICDDLSELKTIIDPTEDPIYDKYTTKSDYIQLKSKDNSCAVCGISEVCENGVYIYKCQSCGTEYANKTVSADVSKYYSAHHVYSDIKSFIGADYSGLLVDEATSTPYVRFSGKGSAATEFIYTRFPYVINGDTYKTMGPDLSYSVGASEYLVIKMRTGSPDQKPRIYLGSRAANTFDKDTLTGANSVQYFLVPTQCADADEWVTYVVSIKDIMASSWVAENNEYFVQTLYIWTNNFASGEYLDVAYISFYESLDDITRDASADDKLVSVTSLKGEYELLYQGGK